ncbi:tetratricopeptide repeat protein [Bremerella cremea]|uniref:tetratricopeptide repeat protein n=1 Tax=Bremerella cremea TaxID=1031537 RepID=UPI0031EAE0A4
MDDSSAGRASAGDGNWAAGDVASGRVEFFLELNRLDEALIEAQRWASLEPHNPYALAQLGYCYSRKFKFREAIENAQAALAISPGSHFMQVNLGVCYHNTAQPEKAIEALLPTLAIDPNDTYVHEILAECYLHTEEYDTALKHCESVIALNPAAASPWNLKGRLLIEKLQPEPALAALREALRREPNHANTHYQMGVCFFMQGKREQARHQFQETLRLDPPDVLAKWQLGRLDSILFPSVYSPFEWYATGLRLYSKGLQAVLNDNATIWLVLLLTVVYLAMWFWHRDNDVVAWILSIAPLIIPYAVLPIWIMPISHTLFPFETNMQKFVWQKRLGLRLLAASLLAIVVTGVWGLVTWDGLVFGSALTAAYVYLAAAQFVLKDTWAESLPVAKYLVTSFVLAIVVGVKVFFVDHTTETIATHVMLNVIGWLGMLTFFREIRYDPPDETEPATEATEEVVQAEVIED